jgi:hypothetical protein
MMEEGGIIRCGMVRHPIAQMQPAARAGLIEIARRLDAMALRWGK